LLEFGSEPKEVLMMQPISRHAVLELLQKLIDKYTLEIEKLEPTDINNIVARAVLKGGIVGLSEGQRAVIAEFEDD
jgi:hypothetical protein